MASKTSKEAKVVGILLLGLFFAIFIQQCARLNHAASQATSLCNSAHIGGDVAPVLQAMRASGGHMHAEEKQASVQFLGFGAQWIGCTIEFTNGKVTKATYWSDD